MSRAASRRRLRSLPLAMAIGCVLALGFAVFTQQVWDMRPCPWCVLQRLLYIVIAVLCVACAFAPWRRARLGLSIAALLVATAGILAAVYQHEVAAKQFTCNLTFADTLVSALGIESLWPAMFKVTATCAESAVSLFGVPYEYWSLALFALLALGAATIALRSVRVDAG